MKYFTLLFLSFTAYSQNYPIGVNLTNDGAFVDLVKTGNRFSNVESYNEHGWPNDDFDYLFDFRLVAEWIGEIDDPEQYRVNISGTYNCSFSGLADISFWGTGVSIENQEFDENNNQTRFDLIIDEYSNQDNYGIFNLTFSNTQQNSDSEVNTGIRNLKIYRPGYPLDSEKIFTDEYLDLCRTANFSCYRYYTIQNIWGTEPTYPEKTTWENRKSPNDANQISMSQTNGKRDGWCWEYIIELSNILNKDIWICIPISADSNYVIELANFLKDNLNDGINIYVENSNEVWSPTHMTHGPYNQSQAEEYGITFDQNYARRTVEISNLFADVFGQNAINDRIRVVMASQAAYLGRSNFHFDYIVQNIGEPKDYIWATAPALYFGSTNPNGSPQEINQGMYESINSQLNMDSRLGHIALAESYELPGGSISYEGGNHIPAGGGTDNLGNQILASRTEEMGDILKYNYVDGWFSEGGGLACHFTLASPYTRYGTWGLTDDYTNPDRNYKIQAIRDLTEIEEETFTLTVINGYGSGEYNEGDTVYIYAKEFDYDQFFDFWTGDLDFIGNPENWVQSLVMPAQNISFEAVISENSHELILTSYIGAEIEKPLFYYFPDEYYGVIYLFHGSGGDIGIVNRSLEMRNFINKAINSGFALVVTEAEESTTQIDSDENGFFRWETFPIQIENNIDLQNIEKLTNYLIENGIMRENAPKFMVGVSNGGFFAQTASLALDFDAFVSFIGQGNETLYDGIEPLESNVPGMWLMAENDSQEGVGLAGFTIAQTNQENQSSKGICAEFIPHYAYPIYSERFQRAGFNEAESLEIFEELSDNGLIENNYLVKNFMGLGEDIQANPTSFPTITNISLSALGDFRRQYDISYAEHVFFDDYNGDVLDFLRGECLNLNIEAANKNIKIYPNPSSDFIYLDGIFNFELFNISGEQVLKGHSNKLDINDLETGIYFIKIDNNFHKIIKY